MLPSETQQKPCKFCQQMATYAPLDELEIYGVKVFYCYQCKAEYLYYTSGGTPTTYASVSLYTEINNKMYRWTIIENGHGKSARLWWIKNPGIPGTRINSDLESVVYFEDFVPPSDITPQNIMNKISLWLPFV